MERVKDSWINAKVEYINEKSKVKINIGGSYGLTHIEINNGSKHIYSGTKREVYETLRVIAALIYQNERVTNESNN